MVEQPLYQLTAPFELRWANPENPRGERGVGGQANHGRKGAPCRGALGSGEVWTLLEADGSGTIRHIWITLSERTPATLRGTVLRIYWDGADTPAVEAPLGDFFCCPHGRIPVFANAWFDTAEGRNFNCTLPMPFKRGCRITVTNESPQPVGMFWYHLDYSVGDPHGDEVGYLHAHYRREGETRLREDFEILPRVTGRGRFLGCNLGVIMNTAVYGGAWWGEGEVKIYLDGDREFPTLCGTGAEDYTCSSWGIGPYALPWYGCPLAEPAQVSLYRLHGPDPIHFKQDLRVTIQQIGWAARESMLAQLQATGGTLTVAGDGTQRVTAEDLAAGRPGDSFLFERQDDWCATAYFYLDRPTNDLPPLAPYAERVVGLTDDGRGSARADV